MGCKIFLLMDYLIDNKSLWTSDFGGEDQVQRQHVVVRTIKLSSNLFFSQHRHAHKVKDVESSR